MNKRSFLLLNIMLGASLAASAGEKANRGAASLTQSFTLGANSIDVTVSFESVQNLSVASLGLSAVVIPDPLDPVLTARLPTSVSIPAAFPIKVNISPPSLPLLGLEFDGVATVELYTVDLTYTPGTRLRLFTAHGGGSFVDITEAVSSGSYRVRGAQGEFSEFLIATDNRDSAAIVNTKFTRLSSLMTTHNAAIDPGVFSALSAEVTSAQSNWLAADIDAAKTDVQDFLTIALAATPAQMPDKWDANNAALVDIAGLLRSAARTLEFSLEDARDTDLDGVYDYTDNCLAVVNPDQCDSNGDGHGNLCDADLDDNGTVNSFDLSIMRAAFGAMGTNVADLDCNGIVNSFDLTRMREGFGGTPGPSAP